jgi:CubicO group peptidase (beta-lactamase class C family)
VNDATLVDGWPEGSAAVAFRLDAGRARVVASAGDLDERRPWASVSKMAVALALGVEHDWGHHDFTESVGPRGATIANLLSHSAGLGLEEGDRMVEIATKRVYSNFGVDHAVAAVVGDYDPAEWLDERVFRALGMVRTRLEGRAAAGVVGPTSEMMSLALAWLRPEGISVATRDRMITPYLAHLDGVVPGFGRFAPCPWGLGPEIQGEKRHWMGDWPSESFGHFGISGALMLLNAREAIGVVATSTEPFGPWAVARWPEWSSDVRRRVLDS